MGKSCDKACKICSDFESCVFRKSDYYDTNLFRQDFNKQSVDWYDAESDKIQISIVRTSMHASFL